MNTGGVIKNDNTDKNGNIVYTGLRKTKQKQITTCLSVTCGRSMIFSGYFGFLIQITKILFKMAVKAISLARYLRQSAKLVKLKKKIN